jgi:hypothetical protein
MGNTRRIAWGVALVVLFLYTLALLWHLGTVPSIFVDEANYANEVISLAKFGTDIHGFDFPVYFSSVWGQGQSVLYALIAAPIVKIFGFSMFTFRLGMVLSSILLISLLFFTLVTSTKNFKVASFVSGGLLVSPWIWTSSRWVLDANIAPTVFLIGLLLVLLATQVGRNSVKWLILLLGAALIGFTAYGYLASWIYLPVFLIGFGIYVLKNRLFTLYNVLTAAIVIGLIVLPIMYFAYATNVLHITTASKFLFFDIPPLPGNRTSSLISFSGNVPLAILNNLKDGFLQYIGGSDELPWNSLRPFGAILPVMLPFSAIALFSNADSWGDGAKNFVSILKISLWANLPLLLIVTPNYNHWNFLNIPLAILSGLGLQLVVSNFRAKGARVVAILMPVFIFVLFVGTYMQPTSFYRSDMIQFSEISKIDNFMKKHPESKLYTDALDGRFMYWRMVQEPITHEQYVAMSANDPEFKKDTMGPRLTFGYLRNSTEFDSNASSSDFILLTLDQYNGQTSKFKLVKEVEFSHKDYVIAEKR